MSINVITPDIAERNRTEAPIDGLVAYTFNALLSSSYSGTYLEFACVRLGDHAHVSVRSGTATPRPAELRSDRYPEYPQPFTNAGDAGRLVLRWHEWLLLRDLLATHPAIRIAEVERPTQGQLEKYAGMNNDWVRIDDKQAINISTGVRLIWVRDVLWLKRSISDPVAEHVFNEPYAGAVWSRAVSE